MQRPDCSSIIDGSEEHVQLTSTAESRSEENSKESGVLL
jgi:hypothetical protein